MNSKINWNLAVVTEGKIGSDFWRYDVSTTPGQTSIATAGSVEARLLSNHYLLYGSPNKPEPFDVFDRDQLLDADRRMRAHLREDVRNFISQYKELGIRITDNDQILGDISDLL